MGGSKGGRNSCNQVASTARRSLSREYKQCLKWKGMMPTAGINRSKADNWDHRRESPCT
jgi:hypothetical protein